MSSGLHLRLLSLIGINLNVVVKRDQRCRNTANDNMLDVGSVHVCCSLEVYVCVFDHSTKMRGRLVCLFSWFNFFGEHKQTANDAIASLGIALQNRSRCDDAIIVRRVLHTNAIVRPHDLRDTDTYNQECNIDHD